MSLSPHEQTDVMELRAEKRRAAAHPKTGHHAKVRRWALTAVVLLASLGAVILVEYFAPAEGWFEEP